MVGKSPKKSERKFQQQMRIPSVLLGLETVQPLALEII